MDKKSYWWWCRRWGRSRQSCCPSSPPTSTRRWRWRGPLGCPTLARILHKLYIVSLYVLCSEIWRLFEVEVEVFWVPCQVNWKQHRLFWHHWYPVGSVFSRGCSPSSSPSSPSAITPMALLLGSEINTFSPFIWGSLRKISCWLTSNEDGDLLGLVGVCLEDHGPLWTLRVTGHNGDQNHLEEKCQGDCWHICRQVEKKSLQWLTTYCIN